jgi:hypothetical protein
MRVFGRSGTPRYAAASMGILFLTSTFTLVGPARLAYADTYRDTSTVAYSGCIPAPDITPAGAGLIIHLHGIVNWQSSHRVQLVMARNDTETFECGVHGGTVPGGAFNFNTQVQFVGSGITGCSAGIPSGVTCSIDPNHSVATVSQAYGPQPNLTGSGTFELDGPVVDAGSAGVITRVQITVYSGLSQGSSAVIGSASVFLAK